LRKISQATKKLTDHTCGHRSVEKGSFAKANLLHLLACTVSERWKIKRKEKESAQPNAEHWGSGRRLLLLLSWDTGCHPTVL
jgi:hypothetical protein